MCVYVSVCGWLALLGSVDGWGWQVDTIPTYDMGVAAAAAARRLGVKDGHLSVGWIRLSASLLHYYWLWDGIAGCMT